METGKCPRAGLRRPEAALSAPGSSGCDALGEAGDGVWSARESSSPSRALVPAGCTSAPAYKVWGCSLKVLLKHFVRLQQSHWIKASFTVFSLDVKQSVFVEMV